MTYIGALSFSVDLSNCLIHTTACFIFLLGPKNEMAVFGTLVVYISANFELIVPSVIAKSPID